jgi:TRAP-type C4-dicarboxylate transport system permease small subunit
MRAINAICRSIEVVSGLLLGAVMLLVVASTLGRYALSNPIPDSFDIARLLIGACLFWGFAVVGLRGGHIQVDLLADLTGPRLRRAIDSFAWILLFVFVCLLVWKVMDGTLSAMRSNQKTYDLRLPIWPFYGLIWLGLLASAFTVALKVWLIMTGKQTLQSAEAQEIEDVAHDTR